MLSETLTLGIIVGTAVIWGCNTVANAVRRGQPLSKWESPSVATEFESPYLEQGILTERVAVGIIAGNLIAGRMSDPRYHEEISRIRQAQSELGQKKMTVICQTDKSTAWMEEQIKIIDEGLKTAEELERQSDLSCWQARRKLVDMAWEIWRDVKLKQEQHYERGGYRVWAKPSQ